MGKRKKKIYTTLKKIKHKHVNKRLNIISSINNHRCFTCNNSMVNHDNRITCSYCEVSYLKKDINSDFL